MMANETLKLHAVEFDLFKLIIPTELFDQLFYNQEGETITIQAAKSAFKQLLDIASDELLEKGFDGDKMNAYGIGIDELIDKLSLIVYID
ncbi:MAG: hypothetical protein ABI367_06260 [Mucilaginibacter sp.]